MEKGKIVNALAVLADMYLTEAERNGGIYGSQSIILRAKADAVNECIELLEELDI